MSFGRNKPAQVYFDKKGLTRKRNGKIYLQSNYGIFRLAFGKCTGEENEKGKKSEVSVEKKPIGALTTINTCGLGVPMLTSEVHYPSL